MFSVIDNGKCSFQKVAFGFDLRDVILKGGRKDASFFNCHDERNNFVGGKMDVRSFANRMNTFLMVYFTILFHFTELYLFKVLRTTT